MNEASQWRFALAQRIGQAYAANPKAKVVMVAGSTGRGTADRYSDLDSAYPTELTHAMLHENLVFQGFGYAEEMLAARDDVLLLYDIFCQVERQILSVLLGLNRIYLPNPGFKSMDELLSEMQVTPPDLPARLKQAFRLPPTEGVQLLHSVVEDVFALVETCTPEFNTMPYRERVRQRRGVWERFDVRL
jgi:hypothetical protein